jgi:Na+/melibiose symporter-like transporter
MGPSVGVLRERLALASQAERRAVGCLAALCLDLQCCLGPRPNLDPGERAKAFGVWAGASGIGGTLGLILGGFLTEGLSWRCTLLVNTPIVLALAIAGLRFITESRIHGQARYDLPDVVTSTVGVASMVYGATQAEGHGWTSVNTLGPMIAGVLLVALFVLIEHRSAQPLLPLSVLTDRVRAGSFGVNALLASAMFANNVLVIYYLQTGLGYSPVESGLAFLPLTVTVVASATVGARLLPRVGAAPSPWSGASAASPDSGSSRRSAPAPTT